MDINKPMLPAEELFEEPDKSEVQRQAIAQQVNAQNDKGFSQLQAMLDRITELNRAPHKTMQDYRMELWIGVATAVAGAVSCTKKEVPGAWADVVLTDFDAKFGRGY